MYKPHPYNKPHSQFGSPDFGKNKNNKVLYASRVVFAISKQGQTIRFQNTDLEVAAIFHIYQV